MVYIGLVRSLLGVILLAGWALGMCDKGLTISILRCVWTYYSITLWRVYADVRVGGAV